MKIQDHQVTDILTKLLELESFRRLRTNVGVIKKNFKLTVLKINK